MEEALSRPANPPATQTSEALQPVDSAIELTILMPCLNEVKTIGECIDKAKEFLSRESVSGEILVADNGSTDGSQVIAKQKGARVIPVEQKGYGSALYSGSKSALGKYVIMGDSDNSYDFSNLQEFLQKLREGYDLVMGNRFAGEVKPGAMPWKNRYIGNPALTEIGRLFFRSPARDFHCGLRGYNMESFKKLDLRTTGMEFASEMVIKATLSGMKIAEVPTTLSPAGRDRASHLRPWRDGWRHLRFMLLYSPRWLFLYPGAALIALGLFLMLWLVPGTLRIFGLGLDVHTLVYASVFIVLGVQAVGFALLSKKFAVNEGLLPADPLLDSINRFISLEVGLLIGLILIIAGLAGSVTSVFWWASKGFGALDARVILRLVIPSATAATLGVQLVLFSFFSGLLDLKTRSFPPDSR